MKKVPFLLLLALLWAGCEYQAPLVTTPEIEMDRSVLGLWRKAGNDGPEEYLLVLPLNEHEYLVSYPARTAKAMFAKASLCRVAGRTLVQLQWFGTAQGRLPDDARVFQYAGYAVTDAGLTVRLLNSQVVSKDAASSAALTRAITAHRQDPNLFRADMVFQKVQTDSAHADG